MKRIFTDFEFNSYKGEVISVGLIKEDGTALYNVFPPPLEQLDGWVTNNVVPYLGSVPRGITCHHQSYRAFQDLLQAFLQEEGGEVCIVTDWPDDVKYFSELLITGPGKMIDIPGIAFEVKRVDPYLNPPKGAVQHNAMWDAVALRHCLTGEVEYRQFQLVLST